ncbi:flagellar biosynthetic protein FliR [Pseudoprimorskyibacter insulae]|uniref:Flagellar biosynthetic protein FliR n=1 Tax=Pseudoprimorskyibacter insulae TaxID=1695997 RepID=A0A2R8AVN2_9RHOB|nr:flagellar biosynthetic protein FliR [Pseudoprimorskyibacter insulae]SPF80092.1 hypothetical protein PRI8871_01894 [Pseudoprimorskyibacter insulae]
MELTTDTLAGIPGLQLSAIIGMALQFLFAMLRVGAFVVSAPLFSARFIPLQVRIILAVFLTIPVMGFAQVPPPETLATLTAVPWMIRELVIGLAAGLVLQILFSCAVMAGELVASTAGLGFAAQMDPATGTQTPVVGQIFSLFLLATFVAEDGHLAALRIVIDSYALIPIGQPIHMGALIEAGSEATRAMYLFAVQLMFPVVSVLLIVNVTIGIITRSAPQMNLFSFGFPLTLSITLIQLYLTAPSLGPAISTKIESALNALAIMTEAAAYGG